MRLVVSVVRLFKELKYPDANQIARNQAIREQLQKNPAAKIDASGG